MKDALGYYQILQVSPTAGFEEIKRSYRDLAKRWHPDYNKDRDTTDIFQELSVAYETLSNEDSRRIYDILSQVYGKENYPDIESMTLFKDGDEGVAVRAVNLHEVRAWFAGYRSGSSFTAAAYPRALRLTAKTAVLNWLAGWWHPKAFLANIKALRDNFKYPLSRQESLRILLHNMIVYAREGQTVPSRKCGLQALELAPVENRPVIEAFIDGLNVKAARPKNWNILALRCSQLIVPVILLAAIMFPAAGSYLNLSEAELWSLFSQKDEIDYYQQVNFGGGQESVDDVVVGKIMSIPVDKSDSSKLYHLLKESKIMYGPSADFDVIKILPAATTVRLTGYTPDNVWARVMIDNGETGFIYYEDIAQGIGKEIPFGSSIIE